MNQDCHTVVNITRFNPKLESENRKKKKLVRVFEMFKI